MPTAAADSSKFLRSTPSQLNQFHSDILGTAIEGGCGWLEAGEIVKNGDDYIALRHCFDTEDTDTKFGDVTLDTIRTGINLILSGQVQISPVINQSVLGGVHDMENVGCYIDADAADCIVQAGLFGEIVYD